MKSAPGCYTGCKTPPLTLADPMIYSIFMDIGEGNHSVMVTGQVQLQLPVDFKLQQEKTKSFTSQINLTIKIMIIVILLIFRAIIE